jgi:hypothetical protein
MRKLVEKDVESYLVDQVEALGGLCPKLISPGGRGFFDRLALLPGGRLTFVEVKRPRGGRVSGHQRELHAAFQALGANVAIVKTKGDVDRLLGRPA